MSYKFNFAGHEATEDSMSSNFKSKNLYIVRHGQTDFNKRGVVQGGGIDADLNDTGRKQAQAFYEATDTLDFDAIYTSSLVRTQQTIQPFVDAGMPFTILAGLNEMNWGVHEGQEVNSESRSIFHSIIKKWRNGEYDVAIEGGESPLQVQNRLKQAMTEIFSKEDEENVLICMHGRSMRILLATLLNYPLSEMDYFSHSNTGYYQLVHTGNFFSVSRFYEHHHINGIK